MKLCILIKKTALLVLILLLSACSFNKDNNVINNNHGSDINIEEEKYDNDNSIKLGLFLSDNDYSNKQRLEDTYYTNFISGTDIGLFEVFLTNERTVNGINFKNIWNKYYYNYENIDNYKIGFNIKFILSDGTNYNANFLEPDIYKFSEYFYVYLYDDIHQLDGSYYSYLESMNDDTLLTSIKIYAVDGIDKVENIILSVFTYDSGDDFDKDGNYRGNSIYVIRIKKNDTLSN